jgi:glycosyltransferase involved in cell wall biosynthesis
VRIVQLNLAADPALADADALLDRYHTLTGWSRALTRAGAVVHVVQRFSSDVTVARDQVSYQFVGEGAPGTADPWSTFPRVLEATRRRKPHVVHVNGLMFPGMAKALRAALGPRCVIVLQDHSGALPRRRNWPISWLQSSRWSRAFRAADAVSFTAPELATRWHHVGLPPDVPVLSIAEASTELTPLDYAVARRSTGITGAPAMLWVGRLNANKDPQTVLLAIERNAARLPAAHLTMVVPQGTSQSDVRRRIDASPTLGRQVSIVGSVDHRLMAAHYSAADIFISASRHEGSGYALIEAMACGVLPCVTDIPAFRALTHGCGLLWRPGDPVACAAAVLNAAREVSPRKREVVRTTFSHQLSWDVIGQQTVAAYRRLRDAAAHR